MCKHRTNSPWRDLPDELGPFQTAHKRLIRWAVDGTWQNILTAVPAAADAGDDIGWTVSVDSTIVRAPPAFRRSTQKGAEGRSEPATTPSDAHSLGRSRGGLSTKVHLVADDRARPLALTVTAGQAGRTRLRSGRGPHPRATKRARQAPNPAVGHARGPGPTPPVPSGPTCERRRRPPARLRRRDPQSSGTASNAASTASSSGAAWPHDATNSPSPTRQHSTSPPSSSGQDTDQRDRTQRVQAGAGRWRRPGGGRSAAPPRRDQAEGGELFRPALFEAGSQANGRAVAAVTTARGEAVGPGPRAGWSGVLARDRAAFTDGAEATWRRAPPAVVWLEPPAPCRSPARSPNKIR